MEKNPQADTAGQQPAAAPAPVSTNDQADYSQPVAYDTQGRPLYLRPQDGAAPIAGAEMAAVPAADPTSATEQSWSPAFNPESHGNHQYVHVSRPIAPASPEIPQEIMERYEDSRRRFPQLNLSQGEFIISAVQRHPIGLVQIWLAAVLMIAALAAVMATFLSGGISQQAVSLGGVGLGLVALLILGGALISTYIYNSNRFFLTNESVIQEIQIGLLNKHEQTVSLANIEDASYYQAGILPYMFNYGTIRLSTEGDETTYRFSYVSNPKRQIAILNNAVEAFKNGRPVDLPSDDQPS